MARPQGRACRVLRYRRRGSLGCYGHPCGVAVRPQGKRPGRAVYSSYVGRHQRLRMTKQDEPPGWRRHNRKV